MFYYKTDGALAMFDLTRQDTFDKVVHYIQDFRQNKAADIPIILVGNASDLVHERVVSHEEATALAQKFDTLYIETSAANMSNVEEAFMTLVTAIYQKKLAEQPDLVVIDGSEWCVI